MTRILEHRHFPAGRRPTTGLAAGLLLLALAGSVLAGAAPDTLSAVWDDSLVVPPPVDGLVVELRGCCWAGADTAVVLVAAADSAAGQPDRLDALLWLDRFGTILRREDLTGVVQRGLAWDGQYLWSLTDATATAPATLVQIAPDSLAALQVYPLRGHRPRDLAWDGKSLWLVDRDLGRLIRIDPETGETLRSVPTPGFSPVGVAADGRHLWVADLGTGRLDRLSAGGRRWTGTLRREVFSRRGRETGLAWGAGGLWTWQPAALVVRRLSAVSRTP